MPIRATSLLPTALAGLGLAAALGLAACSSSAGGDGPKAGGNAGANSGRVASAGSRIANVEITAAKGCVPDKATFPAGGITFKIKNKDATAVSEVELLSGARIVGEKENLPPGFTGEFAATVPAGKYTLYCPGASTERRPITVTGSTATGTTDVAALLKTATQGYGEYVETQVASLLTAAQRLATD